MPETAPPVKVAGVRRYGAEVIFAGTTTLHRKARAEEEPRRRLTMVPPFDDPWVIAGQGTVGLEILEQCPNVTTVFVPAGGGGLISGVGVAIKGMRSSVRIVGVEPEGAAKMSRSAPPVIRSRSSGSRASPTVCSPSDPETSRSSMCRRSSTR